ncbi:acetyltransferase [Rhizobium sp. ERR 922]|uniref:GNAT family N-acetyltransferase n=1 Tax=unclassified Rhizobium TaxID=2613769 RepID=UPI0011AC7E52|nr:MULTISPECIES: GNAT family N-acetyltransferase [unclassified Rhizobium]TWB53193.1 acetyltransferase [Rhizobium sp. ERR 922]TWB95842.1 acetyltransferase [Rhizobium sp. ERR 942]
MPEQQWNIVTRDGLRVSVRPATNGDEGLLTELFDHVSPQDLRFRFFSAIKHVSRKQIAELIGVDHGAVESYIAFARNTATPIATAVLACDRDKKRAEVAISVRSDLKGHGLGWELLSLMVREAKNRGLQTIESIEDRNNYDAVEIEQNMGFRVKPYPDDPRLVLLSKSLVA